MRFQNQGVLVLLNGIDLGEEMLQIIFDALSVSIDQFQHYFLGWHLLLESETQDESVRHPLVLHIRLATGDRQAVRLQARASKAAGTLARTGQSGAAPSSLSTIAAEHLPAQVARHLLVHASGPSTKHSWPSPA